MCQKCNEALVAASQAALNLSLAAKNLYDMNAGPAADTLAKAAAELFEVVETPGVKPEVATPAPGKASPNESKEPGQPTLDSVLNALLGGSMKAESFVIENGIVYINGTAVGKAVVMGGKKPTSH